MSKVKAKTQTHSDTLRNEDTYEMTIGYHPHYLINLFFIWNICL